MWGSRKTTEVASFLLYEGGGIESCIEASLITRETSTGLIRQQMGTQYKKYVVFLFYQLMIYNEKYVI